MDLNSFYFEHQLSLMRARSASSCAVRTKHLDFADALARRIQSHQLSIGASAATSWRSHRIRVKMPSDLAGLVGA